MKVVIFAMSFDIKLLTVMKNLIKIGQSLVMVNQNAKLERMPKPVEKSSGFLKENQKNKVMQCTSERNSSTFPVT